MLHTYLFDFDGTLVDSMPVYVSTMLHILDEYRIPYDPDIVRIITPLGLRGASRYFQTLGLNMDEESMILLMKKTMAEAYFHTIPAKNNVIETLRVLKARGEDLNVLTASPHFTLDACLKRLGIFDLFTNVWSCDDFSTTKSDPEIYRMAAARLGKPVDQILFLDDNLNADKTAVSAGMKVCAVHDASSEEYADEMKRVADAYICDFSELIGLDV